MSEHEPAPPGVARGPLGPLRVALSDRRLLVELVRRDVRARFAGARAGLAWSLLGPLVQLVSYAAVFAFVYRSAAGGRVDLLVATLFCGLWPWWAFQEGTMRGMTALVDQAPLLKRLPLPAEVCVLAAVTSSFVLQAIGFALFLGGALLWGVAPASSAWLWLPAIGLLAWGLAAGLALTLAPLHLVARDTAHVMTAVMTVWFFASPVLYSLGQLPAPIATAMALNPFTAVVGAVRSAVLGLAAPGALAWISCGAAVACSWALGAWLLSRASGRLDEFW